MQKFELTTPTQVKLDHAKGRKEHHGEALVLALDLKVTLATNNKVLDQFDPQLRHALFSALPPGNKPPENQAELDRRLRETARYLAHDGDAETAAALAPLAAAVAYAEHATLASDLRVIGQTLRALVTR